MTADIIAFPTRQQAKALDGLPTPAAFLSDHNSAEDDPPCGVNLWQFHSRSLFALPFVTLPQEKCEDWGEFWKRTSMWNDEPSDKSWVDSQRGRRYAREAVAAVISDGATTRNLEMVVEAICDRGFTRRGPGGGLRRKLSSAEAAFLYELCKIAVKAEVEP